MGQKDAHQGYRQALILDENFGSGNVLCSDQDRDADRGWSKVHSPWIGGRITKGPALCLLECLLRDRLHHPI